MRIKPVADWKLCTKMIISYLLCIIVPLIIWGGVLYQTSRESILEERRSAAKQSVKQYNKIFDEYIRQVDSVTLLPYVDKDLQNYLLQTPGKRSYAGYFNNIDSIYRILEDQFLINKEIDYISLASLNGQILSLSANGRIRAEYEFLGNEEYAELFSSTGELIFSSRHMSRYWFAPREPVFTVGRKILDFYEGFYSGYILVDCSMDIFDRVCKQMGEGEEKHVLIADGKGRLLYTSEKKNSWENEESVLSLAQQNTGKRLTWSMNGQEVYSVMDTSETTGWTVYEVLPCSAILDSIKPIRNVVFILSGCCIMLAILCSLIIANSISNPIRHLQKIMAQVEEGNTALRSDIKNQSEVGQLSLTFNHLLDRIEQLLTVIKGIEIKKREAQLDALMSQINPHFLYNTLESIRMMAVIEDQDDIARAIEALSDLFRYTIRGHSDIIDVEEELEYIKNYILLQKIRFEDRLQDEYDVDETLLHHKMIKLTIQPLVENAIVHGLTDSDCQGFIRISVKREGGDLLISVQDNGVGIAPNKLREITAQLNTGGEAGTGIGLNNIHQRIVMYFGKGYGLSLTSRPMKGTCAVLRLPATTDGEWVKQNVINFSGR